MIHPLLKLAGLNVIQQEQLDLNSLNELLFADPVLFYYPGFDGSDFKPVMYINKTRFPLLTEEPEIFIFSESNEYGIEPDFKNYCQIETAPVEIKSTYSLKTNTYSVTIHHIKLFGENKWVISFHKTPENKILNTLITNKLKAEVVFTVYSGLYSFPGQYQYYYFLFQALGVKYQITDIEKPVLVTCIDNDDSFKRDIRQIENARESLPPVLQESVLPLSKRNAITFLNELPEISVKSRQYPYSRPLYIRTFKEQAQQIEAEQANMDIEAVDKNENTEAVFCEQDSKLQFSAEHLQSLFKNNPATIEQLITSNPGKQNNIIAIASGQITTDIIYCDSFDNLDEVDNQKSEKPISNRLAEQILSDFAHLSTSSKNRLLTITGIRRVEDFTLDSAARLISIISSNEEIITNRFSGLRNKSHLELNRIWRKLKLLK